MRTYTILAALVVAALTLGGCQAARTIAGTYGGEKGLELFDKAAEGVEKIENATLGNAAKAVAKYCDKAPVASRKLLRDRINARPEMAGAKIGVQCPGEPNPFEEAQPE